MIRFYSTFKGFGGSTLILRSVVRMLNDHGVAAVLHDDFPELAPEDVLVFHGGVANGEDLVERPNVRLSVYVSHEETYNFSAGRFLCPCGASTVARIRAGHRLPAACLRCFKRSAEFQRLVAYDVVVFSSDNHAAKSKAAQAFWGPSVVIPNRVEVDFEWSPPREPTAGIIGTVEARKATHVSIQKAREAGFKRILLYGPKDDAYFQSHVVPLLDEDTRFMGLEMDRQRIYNSISEVFHFSTQEQALMVLGECKRLGIPFHGSNAVHDWNLYSDAYILDAWRSLLGR